MDGEEQSGDFAPLKGLDAAIGVVCLMVVGWLVLSLSPLPAQTKFSCIRPEPNKAGNCVLERHHLFSKNERNEFPEDRIIMAEYQHKGGGVAALVDLELSTGERAAIMTYALDNDAELAAKRFNEYLANQEMLSYEQPIPTNIPQKILVALIAIGGAGVIVIIRTISGYYRN